MRLSQMEEFYIATGYVRKPDGSWIVDGLATPAIMQFHCWYYEDYYKNKIKTKI